MKLITKIKYSGTAIVILMGLYFSYRIYQNIAGSESLSGEQENIPLQTAAYSSLSTGNSDWPNWRGPNHDGKSRFKGLKTEWKGGLKKLWQVNYLCQHQNSATWSSPVIKGNRLVVPGRDEKNDLVFCINSDNGELIWTGKYETEAGSSHGPGARATPVIDGEYVYSFGRSGDLVCWQLENGKIIWRKNIKNDGGQEPRWGFSSSPLIMDNKVIVQGGGTALITAYDKLTGELIWKSMEGKGGYAAVIPFLTGNKRRLVVYHGTGLSCIDSENGKSLWTAPWKTDYEVNATTPLISGDSIFNTSAYKMGCQLLKVNENGYTVVWKSNVLEAQHTDPVLIGNYLYGYSGESSRNSGQFKCIELKSGKEMWSNDKIGQGTITYADGYLICLDIKGNLALVDPDPSGFRMVQQIKSAIKDVKSPAWTVPVVANGKLYLRYLQQLICYDITN